VDLGKKEKSQPPQKKTKTKTRTTTRRTTRITKTKPGEKK